MFLNYLYGGMDEPELKIIDVFICKLRRKIAEALNDDSYIETVWGRGYVLKEPEMVVNAPKHTVQGVTSEHLKKGDISLPTLTKPKTQKDINLRSSSDF